MVDKKSAFKIYGSYAEQVNALTDSEAGRLFKALVNYKNGEEPKNLSGMVRTRSIPCMINGTADR